VSWPKAMVYLPPPWGSPRTVDVIGHDRRAVIGVDGKVRITNGEVTREMGDIELFDDIPDDFQIVEEAILWVRLRCPFPQCERRFEIPKRDVVWVNTEAAHAFGIGTSMPVIGVGYGADQKMEHYRKEMGLCASDDGT